MHSKEKWTNNPIPRLYWATEYRNGASDQRSTYDQEMTNLLA